MIGEIERDRLKRRRVTVMGLGRHGGGVAVARYLSAMGAAVTVSDQADELELRPSLAQLSDSQGLRIHVGGHREADFRNADVVVVNPAVRPGNRLVDLAREQGAEITSEIDLFLQACRAPVVGVTGTNGKSTTAAMIAAILRADGRRCHLGGNIGGSLLGELETISASDWVVLELSSFQLARLRDDTPGVEVAVVTGCSPHHLDWHGSFAAYVAAKQRLLTMQAGGTKKLTGADQPAVAVLSDAVLNDRDPSVAGWSSLVRGRHVPSIRTADVPPLAIPGGHNRQNAALAAATAGAVGCSQSAIREALESFGGLPHRLQVVAEYDGRRLIDDSQATTPEATIAGLEALPDRIWLLFGGYDSGADFADLAKAIAGRPGGACCYGAAGRRIAAAIRRENRRFAVDWVTTLAEAFAWCWHNSRPGDSLFLSPACASFDQFRDAEERSRRFALLAESVRPEQASRLGPAERLENYL